MLVQKEVTDNQEMNGHLYCIKCEKQFNFNLECVSGSEYFWEFFNHTTVGAYLTTREQHQINLALDRNLSVNSVLDACCGNGRYSIPLIDRGFDVISLDCDSTPMYQLKGKEADVRIIRGDAVSLPIRDKSLDCIIIIQALHYINRSLFFKECNRVLRQGGLLLLSEMTRHSYKKIFRRLQLWRNYVPWPYPSLRELKHDLNDHGFAIKRIRGYNWIPMTRWNNSKAVNLFALIEKLLRLEMLASVSPWVFVTTTKQTDISEQGSAG